ncbi:hypothetical protein NODU109028_06140 [Nocardioides dubius]|uniref:Uncharacterized protein n=1 Tax=Nocardioides dubius TaxID=317019 RepID=A0ABP4EQ98_9ACTN
MALGLVLVVLLSLGWWWSAGSALDDVEVTSDQQMVCTSRTVERPDLRADDAAFDRPVQAPRLDPDLDCELILRVSNPQRLPVRLRQIELPMMGAQGGAGVRVARVTVGKERLEIGNDVDGVIDVDRTLGRDDSFAFKVEYAFRPGGCTATGTMGVPPARAVVSALGRDRTVEMDEWIHLAGTKASSC